jgi:hypothetical protein
MATATPKAPVEPIAADANAPLWGWYWLRRSDPLDRLRFLAIARKHGWDPNALAAIVQIESGGDPGKVNDKSGASGLIQWMPDTAELYGTTVRKIRSMTTAEQLPLAERYWRDAYRRGPPSDVGDYYMGVFMPDFMGAPENQILSLKGLDAVKGTSVYDQNAGLDWDRDGMLTASDVRSVLRSFYANWKAMRDRGSIGDLNLTAPTIGPPFPFAGGRYGKPWAWVAAGLVATAAVVVVRRLRP